MQTINITIEAPALSLEAYNRNLEAVAIAHDAEDDLRAVVEEAVISIFDDAVRTAVAIECEDRFGDDNATYEFVDEAFEKFRTSKVGTLIEDAVKAALTGAAYSALVDAHRANWFVKEAAEKTFLEAVSAQGIALASDHVRLPDTIRFDEGEDLDIGKLESLQVGMAELHFAPAAREFVENNENFRERLNEFFENATLRLAA